ncbi:MAG: nucleotidyltransferase family protein [Candidatus Thermoplasmatota archaeon]|nr:nucleotidyltransferase family protein [Candidatus Thermoplasmatota archaeon]
MNVTENTVAIVLAAGKSKRLGEPKALLNCGDQTLIEFIVKRLESIGLKVIVVTNSLLEKSIKKSLSSTKATLLIPKNTNYRTGNLIAGLNTCNNPEKILVVPVDRPGWSLNTIKLLIKNNETSFQNMKGREDILF